MKTDRNLIIIPDFMVALKYLEKCEMSVSALCFKTKITYSHLHYIKNAMYEKDWIIMRKEGRKLIIALSSKGRELVGVLNQLFEKLGVNEINMVEFRKQTKTMKTKEKEVETVVSEPEEVVEEKREEVVEEKREEVVEEKKQEIPVELEEKREEVVEENNKENKKGMEE